MNSLGSLVVEFAQEILRPPERLTVTESAEKYRHLNNPGAYVGPWLSDMVPYLREAMDVLSSREFDSMVFVGPAQSSKTEMFLNWVTYSVLCDPMDMILYQTSQTTARDFSRRRLDRLHLHTEEVGRRMLMGTHSDNVFDKQYRSGMLLTLSWPSINELSGRPIPRVWQTDYDRMPQNVDGEGSPFDLGRKRTTTFGAAAMTVAESSPGFIVDNPKWIRSTPHEAPPCKGILSLYNRGDRRRWHWQCPHCGQWFEPEFSLLRYDRQTRDATAAGESAMMLCPNPACGCLLTPDMKPALNRGGRWVRDGMRLDKKGRLHGTPYRSKTASFWLKGPAAAFASWATLVSRYVQAEQEFARTGEQEALKSVVNTDLGEPYYLRGSEVHRDADQIKEMAETLPDTEGPVVPEWVRFLVATVDVQKHKFVVQVTGIGPRKNGFRMTVVDYFDILKSDRLDDDGEHLLVSPGAFPEDWRLLKGEVLGKAYPIEGGVGEMRVSHLGYDTGGREGVTNNAYDFYRWLKRTGNGEHTRVFPLKGDSSPNAPRVALSYPDSKRKDRHANARGEIPVLMLNPTILKDGLQGMIDRAAEALDALADGGSGRGERTFTWPDYLLERWYAEMCAEIRTSKGWECPSGARNEAWDCSYYAYAVCLHLKVDRIAWDKPPTYARPHAANPFATVLRKTPTPTPSPSDEKPRQLVKSGHADYSPLRQLAGELT
jgi:phage terminase large subunit GpA-like protein